MIACDPMPPPRSVKVNPGTMSIGRDANPSRMMYGPQKALVAKEVA